MKALKIGNLLAQLPIVQGGMGVGISLSRLASAVANEGGVGVISAAGLGLVYKDYSPDFDKATLWGLKEEIRKARKASRGKGGLIGVNIMVAMTDFANLVKTAISERVDIIFSGAGLPLSLPTFLTEGATTKLAPIVSSARALKVICRNWIGKYGYVPDAVVVEGPKAGGHLGFSHEQIEDPAYSLEQLVPEVVAAVREIEQEHGRKIPVIAGGGIYTGEDIYNIMQLGADGVQMGTRFVATKECDASDGFKQAYVDAKQEDIELIQSPVGMPGRAIHNSFLQKVKEGLKHPKSCPFHCIKTCKVEESPYCIMTALFNAFRGQLEHGYAFCGSNAWRTERIMQVRELIEGLKEEFRSARAKFGE
ncbi:MAG: nitronate monooxygenase [Alistipes sp.]|nr:nitronate monooxygenase [Alistipes sp.]